MPLDIMSGFSGAAAPTSAAQPGTPPVNGSEPTVTFASLLSGNKADATPGAVKKSVDGAGDTTKDDTDSDTKTEDTPATLDLSLTAQALLPSIVTPQNILLPQTKKSEPSVPSITDCKAGTSAATDASPVLSRLQASGSQTGGELLSTLKQTIASAATPAASAAVPTLGVVPAVLDGQTAKLNVTASAIAGQTVTPGPIKLGAIVQTIATATGKTDLATPISVKPEIGVTPAKSGQMAANAVTTLAAGFTTAPNVGASMPTVKIAPAGTYTSPSASPLPTNSTGAIVADPPFTPIDGGALVANPPFTPVTPLGGALVANPPFTPVNPVGGALVANPPFTPVPPADGGVLVANPPFAPVPPAGGGAIIANPPFTPVNNSTPQMIAPLQPTIISAPTLIPVPGISTATVKLGQMSGQSSTPVIPILTANTAQSAVTIEGTVSSAATIANDIASAKIISNTASVVQTAVKIAPAVSGTISAAPAIKASAAAVPSLPAALNSLPAFVAATAQPTVNLASPAAASNAAIVTNAAQTAASTVALPIDFTSVDISGKITLQNILGSSDNKNVSREEAQTKGAGKENAASLLQSLNGKASISRSIQSPISLSEALVKSEIKTDNKIGNDATMTATLTGSELGTTAATIQDQPVIAPMPAQDRAAMISKVVDKIGEMKLDAKGTGGDSVKLQLHPQDWGQLNLTVTMTPKVDASGQTTTTVTAHVSAENPVVKQALESHLSDLHRTLSEHGMKLDSMTVTVDAASTVSAAAQSGGSGLNPDQRQSDSGAQSQSQTSQSSAQSGSFDGSGQNGRAFADFGAGQFGSGQRRDNSDQTSWTAHDADLDITPAAAVRSNVSSRIDYRA